MNRNIIGYLLLCFAHFMSCYLSEINYQLIVIFKILKIARTNQIKTLLQLLLSHVYVHITHN